MIVLRLTRLVATSHLHRRTRTGRHTETGALCLLLKSDQLYVLQSHQSSHTLTAAAAADCRNCVLNVSFHYPS